MALEIPIVASDLPAVREILTPDQALLVAPSDATTLAEAIGASLDVPDDARRRADAARHRFLQEFTAAATARGMLDFYRRALDRDRAA